MKLLLNFAVARTTGAKYLKSVSLEILMQLNEDQHIEQYLSIAGIDGERLSQLADAEPRQSNYFDVNIPIPRMMNIKKSALDFLKQDT